MKKKLIRRLVILAAFLISFVGFFILFNQGTTDLTAEMSEASFPLIYIKESDYLINEMHGYTDRMNTGALRDSITTIGEDRVCNFVVDKYGTGVSSLKFEVRSIDGERLIEETRILDFDEDGDKITGSITLKDLIDEGIEYSLAFIAGLEDGRTVYYYTVIIQQENAGIKDMLDFLTDFNEKTFSKEKVRELATYLEPSSDSDNTNLGSVNIHNSLDQISFGSMNPKIVSDRQYTIKEIEEGIACIGLKYSVAAGSGEDQAYYDISEVYRIRKSDTRYHLLSFDRTMDRIFVMDKNACVNDKIMLGILKSEPEMLESDGGEVLAFINGGRLFTYNVTDNKMARLFAFFDDYENDYRDRIKESDIKILDVEENGNVSFAVYGYMNRGIHEGKVGIELCYYHSPVNTVEEVLFIPVKESASACISDSRRLSYVNKRGVFFSLIEGKIYSIDSQDHSCEIAVDDFDEDSFYVSESNRTVAWSEEKNGNTSVCVMNLDSGNKRTIEGHGEYIVPIGFMKEDFIYGVCNISDNYVNVLGDSTTMMNRILIMSDAGEILKEYSRPDIYITSGSIEENQITLKRVSKSAETGTVTPVIDDYITNSEEKNSGKNKVVKVATDLYQNIYQIQVKSNIGKKNIKFLTPKQVLYEGERSVVIPEEDKTRYYVYGNEGIDDIFTSAGRAVSKAYDLRGTVTDDKGMVIYRRGALKSRNQIIAITERGIGEGETSLSVCLDTMLKFGGISKNTMSLISSGVTADRILEDNLPDAYILNLTGCKLGSILYYVNQDIPVLAITDDDRAYLVIGFNEQNIVLMDPSSGTIYKKGMKDSESFFEENGNRFMTYARKKTD
ncbi:MAG: hypothetical protein K5662_04475 [Lachnospiraceae bacterium]|nr:hypothetical protein [Lachnospiraceae bacterium]